MTAKREQKSRLGKAARRETPGCGLNSYMVFHGGFTTVQDD
jgi:hypothetical protein